MTTLRVIIDQMIAPVPGGIGRYTEELTRELIATAPAGCAVSGVVSSSPDSDYRDIADRLPGLAGLNKSALARRELSLAWQHGFTRIPGEGMLHSTSLLAPLGRHDRLNNRGDQVVVTIHDTVPWSHPETLTPRGVSWHRGMAKRAQRFADAIVVPTHAVAAELSAILDVGDRIRVIGGAVSSKLAIPSDADARAERLGLPERYVIAVGTLEPRKGLDRLIAAMGSPALRSGTRSAGTGSAGASLSGAGSVGAGSSGAGSSTRGAPGFGSPEDIPLLIAGPAGWGGVDVAGLAAGAGLEPGRVRALGYLSDADLAVAVDRATVFVYPSLAEGFGLPVLEAMKLGTPVVITDVPAVLEVADDAALVVQLADEETFVARLAAAIRRVIDEPLLAERLGLAGMDRARAFSWRASAEKVWQLHADL